MVNPLVWNELVLWEQVAVGFVFSGFTIGDAPFLLLRSQSTVKVEVSVEKSPQKYENKRRKTAGEKKLSERFLDVFLRKHAAYFSTVQINLCPAKCQPKALHSGGVHFTRPALVPNNRR
ncbi:MAG: hypothetical protein VX330_06820 [Candidatus Thermoplasmatota archaeon]|nr:hypothetical protein [Candidatus Thermoplasmatota archaeon]